MATGVPEPEASGDLSPVVVCSGIAESLLGDILSSGNARLFTFTLVADICARGFLLLVPDLPELVLEMGRGDLCAYSYISVGVPIMLVGVSGSFLFVNFSRYGKASPGWIPMPSGSRMDSLCGKDSTPFTSYVRVPYHEFELPRRALPPAGDLPGVIAPSVARLDSDSAPLDICQVQRS